MVFKISEKTNNKGNTLITTDTNRFLLIANRYNGDCSQFPIWSIYYTKLKLINYFGNHWQLETFPQHNHRSPMRDRYPVSERKLQWTCSENICPILLFRSCSLLLFLTCIFFSVLVSKCLTLSIYLSYQWSVVKTI